MSLLEFRDTQGVVWRVWDVRPQWTNRRERDRRSPSHGTFIGDDRRKLPGRRWSVPDTEPRVRVRPGYEQGWLACETSTERRRVAPIPEHWEELSNAELEALCRNAPPTGRRPGRLLE
jgi:hypothetical protein